MVKPYQESSTPDTFDVPLGATPALPLDSAERAAVKYAATLERYQNDCEMRARLQVEATKRPAPEVLTHGVFWNGNFLRGHLNIKLAEVDADDCLKLRTADVVRQVTDQKMHAGHIGVFTVGPMPKIERRSARS